MFTHSYSNLRAGIAHARDYCCRGGHVIHGPIETIFYDSIVWC